MTMKPKIPGGRSFDYRALNQPQLAIGTAVELEHTSRRDVAREIAAAHLQEDPDYYTKLRRMERGHCNPGPHSRKLGSRSKKPAYLSSEARQDRTQIWWQSWLRQNGFPTQGEVTSNIRDIIKNRGLLAHQSTYGDLLNSLASAGRFYDWHHWYFIEPRSFPMYFPSDRQTVSVKDVEHAYLSVLSDLYGDRPVREIPRAPDSSRASTSPEPARVKDLNTWADQFVGTSLVALRKWWIANGKPTRAQAQVLIEKANETLRQHLSPVELRRNHDRMLVARELLDKFYQADLPAVEALIQTGRNPKQNPDHGISEQVIIAYQRFHGVPPDSFTDRESTWVPGELVEVGRGVDTGYGITDRRSNKDGWYVHDFGHDVHVYRRARPNETPDIVWEDFPRETWILGHNLGFTYEDPSGRQHEVKANRTKQLATNDAGDMLIVIGPNGVEYILKGGRMRVEDWIRD